MKETIKSVYTMVTEQVTGITLTESPARKKRIENPISVVVLSKGIFKSKAIIFLPEDFEEYVVGRMNRDGSDLSPDDKDAYFREYLNMFFGRFISAVNNEIGRASRFVIPVLLRGTYRDTGTAVYTNRVEMDFMSEQGRISIVMSYEVVPAYSSN